MSLIATFFLLCHKAVQLVEHFGSLIDSHDVDIQSVHSCQDTKGLVTSTLVIRQHVAVQPTNSPELDQLDQDKINSIRTRSIGSGQDQLDQDKINWIRKERRVTERLTPSLGNLPGCLNQSTPNTLSSCCVCHTYIGQVSSIVAVPCQMHTLCCLQQPVKLCCTTEEAHTKSTCSCNKLFWFD